LGSLYQDLETRRTRGTTVRRYRSAPSPVGIVRVDEAGERLQSVRIDNDPVALGLALAEAGPDPRGALEATHGWYWAADMLQAAGMRVGLVHPSEQHWGARRVKNDERDATEIAHRPRRDDLPEAWIAPPQVRELRELVRFRPRSSPCAPGSRPRFMPCWRSRVCCPGWMTSSAPKASGSWTRPR
jgi:transposase